MKRWIAAWIGVVLVACGATPIPDPPDLDPPDRERMTASPMMGLVATTVTIDGDAGSAVPGTILQIVRLDTELAPALTLVAEDGSFHAELDAEVGEELRLSFRDGASRSPPTDLVVPAVMGRFDPARRVSCVALPSELDLGDVIAGDSVTLPIVLESTCPDETAIAVRMRVRSSALSISGDTVLPAGGTAMIEATFAPASAGTYEEIAFAELGGARHPITLFGSAQAP